MLSKNIFESRALNNENRRNKTKTAISVSLIELSVVLNVCCSKVYLLMSINKL